MNQKERREALIRCFISENQRLALEAMPEDEHQQRRLLRSLMNIREPKPVPSGIQEIQDAYLQEETRRKGIVTLDEIRQISPGLYLWRGDITRLAVGAIVNAANSALLGCFIPCHGCIDNAIHSAAGTGLRLECAGIMERQGYPEPTGSAKITRAYALPCEYVIHTVGPIIERHVSQEDCEQLASCYRACLQLALDHHLASIAFCCISTGEFRFPNRLAARIAVDTVREFRRMHPQAPTVVFNVFKEEDYVIYKELLG